MIDWHERFQEQLNWTSNLRDYLYKKIKIIDKNRLLEIGCGTGALLKDTAQKTNAALYGIDIDEERLEYAKANLKKHEIYWEFINVTTNLFIQTPSFDPVKFSQVRIQNHFFTTHNQYDIYDPFFWVDFFQFGRHGLFSI